jgi:hypothetical protein
MWTKISQPGHPLPLIRREVKFIPGMTPPTCSYTVIAKKGDQIALANRVLHLRDQNSMLSRPGCALE